MLCASNSIDKNIIRDGKGLWQLIPDSTLHHTSSEAVAESGVNAENSSSWVVKYIQEHRFMRQHWSVLESHWCVCFCFSGCCCDWLCRGWAFSNSGGWWQSTRRAGKGNSWYKSTTVIPSFCYKINNLCICEICATTFIFGIASILVSLVAGPVHRGSVGICPILSSLPQDPSSWYETTKYPSGQGWHCQAVWLWVCSVNEYQHTCSYFDQGITKTQHLACVWLCP